MSGTSDRSGNSRGRPLLVFTAALAGWLVLRVWLWQPPFAHIVPERLLAQAVKSMTEGAVVAPSLPVAHRHGSIRSTRARRQAAPGLAVPGSADASVAGPPPPSFLSSSYRDDALPAVRATPTERLVGQQLLLAAASSQMKLAPETVACVAGEVRPVEPPSTLAENGLPADRPVAPCPPGPSRWTGDTWLLLRKDSTGPLAAGEPSYGRSQAGAVLRYRLSPSSVHRPVVYARATRALAGPHETEVAVGLAARPLPGVPLSVAAETRVYDSLAGREVRPAAFAVTELPPAKLPFGLRGEGYAQAGYVGGSFATAFVDGQARIDGKVALFGRDGELRAGAGVWGGAQKDAARLDIGPSATVSFRLGETRSRVALDYRVRVAGHAEPKSGPALTISAGF